MAGAVEHRFRLTSKDGKSRTLELQWDSCCNFTIQNVGNRPRAGRFVYRSTAVFVSLMMIAWCLDRHLVPKRSWNLGFTRVIWFGDAGCMY